MGKVHVWRELEKYFRVMNPQSRRTAGKTKSLSMSDLPQGTARERAGSTANSSGFAVAIKTAISKLTASNKQM